MRISQYLSDANNLKLERALLIYSDGDKATCTEHRVAPDPRQQDRPLILAGVPVERVGIIQLARQLAGAKQSDRRHLLPFNLLVAAVDCLIWYQPSARRRIFVSTHDKQFNADVNGREVLHPALLFMAQEKGHGRDLYVWALAGSERPDEKTKLYRAPYFNVYENAHLCEGSYKLPDNCDPAGIPKWEAAFFDTHFSHTNLDARRLCRHPHGHNALWREMLKTRAKSFPPRYLQPLEEGMEGKKRPMTLERVMQS